MKIPTPPKSTETHIGMVRINASETVNLSYILHYLNPNNEDDVKLKFTRSSFHNGDFCARIDAYIVRNDKTDEEYAREMAEYTKSVSKWLPDDSGDWIEVDENEMNPPQLPKGCRILPLIKYFRDLQYFRDYDKVFDQFSWNDSNNSTGRIVAYKIIPPTVKYRTALMMSCDDMENYTTTADTNREATDLENSKHFTRWLGDWEYLYVDTN